MQNKIDIFFWRTVNLLTGHSLTAKLNHLPLLSLTELKITASRNSPLMCAWNWKINYYGSRWYCHFQRLLSFFSWSVIKSPVFPFIFPIQWNGCVWDSDLVWEIIIKAYRDPFVIVAVVNYVILSNEANRIKSLNLYPRRWCSWDEPEKPHLLSPSVVMIIREQCPLLMNSDDAIIILWLIGKCKVNEKQ